MVDVSQERWSAVDDFIDGQFVQPDAILDDVLAASSAAGLPSIAVSPSQGKLLCILAKAIGARRILEVGTLGGYSAIWLARALPAGGTLVTIEVEPRHADVARRNFQRAGVASKVDVQVGPALDVLDQISREHAAAFDFTFIDADKVNYPAYLEWAIKLSRPGSLIVGDNVVRDGEIINAESNDPAVQGMRRFLAILSADPRVEATAIQTVGVKGYDGLAIARVIGAR